MAIDDAALRRLCDPCLEHVGLHEPHTIDLDGEPWSFGCDGHMLLARVGGGFASLDQKRAKHVRRYFAPARRPETTVAALRVWAGPAVWPTETVCPACNGVGGCECGYCDGERTVTERIPQRPGLFDGQLIDRQLVACCLEAVPGGPVLVKMLLHGILNLG